MGSSFCWYPRNKLVADCCSSNRDVDVLRLGTYIFPYSVTSFWRHPINTGRTFFNPSNPLSISLRTLPRFIVDRATFPETTVFCFVWYSVLFFLQYRTWYIRVHVFFANTFAEILNMEIKNVLSKTVGAYLVYILYRLLQNFTVHIQPQMINYNYERNNYSEFWKESVWFSWKQHNVAVIWLL